MKYPETYLKKVTEWLMKIKFDKRYKIDSENAEVSLACAKKLNGAQKDFVIYVGEGIIIKKDDEDNLNNYFHITVQTWNKTKKDFVPQQLKIPQRHQLARIIGRSNPTLGKILMSKVKYEINTKTWRIK